MSPGGPGERGSTGAELEVGGLGLLLGAALVVALCVVSFLLGRWSVGVVAPVSADPASPAMEDAGDVEAELTFFDRLEKAPELSARGNERTVRGPEPPAREPSTPPATADAPSGGPFEVQVLAVAERAAAEAVVARLRLRGYPAHLLEGERAGAPLFRVRVGGYADEASAQQAAREIEREEGLRTWVTR